MADLSALAQRIKEAVGPDSALDRDIWEAVTGECTHRKTHFVYLEDDERELECSDCGADTYGKDKWTGLSRSLDAALALCERAQPGWRWTITSDGRKEGVPRAWLWIERRWIEDSDLDPPMLRNHDAEAATPALALIAALLASLPSQGTTP